MYSYIILEKDFNLQHIYFIVKIDQENFVFCYKQDI